MSERAGGDAVAAKTARRRWESVAFAAAAVTLGVYCLARYRDAVFSFFFLDDFWLLRDASALRWSGPLDAMQILRPTHAGFRLYRPFTQTGYFAFLWSVFGCDASGYHAVQLLAYAGTAVLVFAIARRLTGSIQAGLGAGLIYATAPGHALSVFWIAAFTMTGTALIVFCMIWMWLRIEAPRQRTVVCTILQVLALLASEHAIVAPVLLALIGWGARPDESWGRRWRLLTPLLVVVAVYAVLKIGYFASQPPSGPYAVSADPARWLAAAGHYALGSINWLKGYRSRSPGRGSLIVGATLLLLAIAAAWRGAVIGGAWRLLATGIGVFLVALLPVLALDHHFYDYFVGIAALGIALAVVATCQLLSRRAWPSLALAAGVALVLYDTGTGQTAERSDRIFLLIERGARTSASWVMGVADATGPEIRDVVVPRDSVTDPVFAIGHAERVFPHMPARVTLLPAGREAWRIPGRAVVFPDRRRDDVPELPCWDTRWAWIRALAGWNLPPRQTSHELPNAPPRDRME